MDSIQYNALEQHKEERNAIEILKQLTEISGVSGDEDRVQEYVCQLIKEYTDNIEIDSMGNIIAFKKGINSKFKVMLSAHMDEVGLIITGYKDKLLKFKSVGGIDERILLNKRVSVGDSKIPGVIGAKPIHLQKKAERTKPIGIDSMFIDIGAEDKKELERLVPRGTFVAFDSKMVEFGEGCIKAKALDDRVGCAILMDMIRYKFDFDLYCCFTVQEEVGLRGSAITTYRVEPDIAIVVEGTTCSDVAGVEEQFHTTKLKGGAALSFMDRTTVYDKELLDFIKNVAESNNIKYQLKKTVSGGNDSGRIQRSLEGVRVATISIPCRYIHSPVSVMSKEDFFSSRELVRAVLNEINNKGGVNYA